MTRIRSKNVDQYFEISGYRIDEFGTETNNWSGTTLHQLPHYMEDEVQVGYFSKMKRGQFLDVQPMYKTDQKITSSGSTWDFYMTYQGTPKGETHWTGDIAMSTVWWYAGTTFPSYTGSTPSFPDQSALVTEALAKARSRGWDALTFLAEWQKTVNMIENFRSNVLKRAQKVADSIGKSSIDPVTQFASTWLEARYGWRTLIYDISDIREQVDKLNSFVSPLIRGYAEDENVAESTRYDFSTPFVHPKRYKNNASAPFWGAQSGLWTQKRVSNRRAGVLLEVLLQDFLEIDPLVTGWEIVPFSFIVDWFTNVGDVIKAYSPFAQENLLGAWVTDRQTTTLNLVLDAATANSGSWKYTKKGSAGPAFVLHEANTITRTPVTPSASLTFDVNLDELKVLDLASIFLTRWAGILGGIVKSNRI